MSEKRKDRKGRNLLNGESQKKDGRYEYKYTDLEGRRRTITSWTLVSTDKMPEGKRQKSPLSLREQKKRILKDLADGIDTRTASVMTLNQLFEVYISDKIDLKQSTRTNYKYMYGKFVSDSLGRRKITEIKYTDIRRFYTNMITKGELQVNTLENIHSVLHPVFRVAVRDELIRSNPTDGVMADLKKSCCWEKKKRHALTEQQQAAFIDFVSESVTYRHWLPVFTILLGTGGRIGEVLGLRWEDCDFEKEEISINHTLTYRPQEDGKSVFHISTPKTKAGTRVIPMFGAVKNALLQEKKRQMQEGMNATVIDGYSNFVLKNRDGSVYSPASVNRAISRIYKAYNEAEVLMAEVEKREPVLLPHFSAHNLRHTFCTRLCENETNIKVIQEIMGHTDISTTMDVYNEATMDKKKESFARLEGKIKIC